MNISYNWLKKYLDFDLTPTQLADALTSIGLETGTVEEVESIRGGLRGLVTGKVLTCIDHPDSDHLHITTVDLGNGEAPAQIVCGAPNVAAGQSVIVATVGTTLYDGDKSFQIKKSKIRGVESFGMICAEDEIGVGSSHAGIIVLPDDVKPGIPAAEYYGLSSDYVLEVDLTPNRVDAASHYGVARDLSAWMTRHHATAPKLHRPAVDEFKIDKPEASHITVTVEDTTACPRYCGVTICGVKVTESPKWLKDCLSVIGQRPINNIVDITNFILHGIGQPLHCFDTSKIDGGRIVVRTCEQGTPFTTLDGVEHKLDNHDLMICSASSPMCIAGVFGGLDSGVTENTTDIFIESAYFNPTSVRKTARRHGLSTDASFRYERGLDPNATIYALKLAALLVKQLAGGEICGELQDVYPTKIDPWEVTLDYDYVRRLVGKNIDKGTIDSIIKSLEIQITSADDQKAHLLVPTYRVDVKRPCDVVEDMLRIYGYNNVEISSSVHSALSSKSIADVDNSLKNIISEQLTAIGFNEIMNNSLTAESYYADLKELSADTCVRLLNPLSGDLAVMRRTLLFGGLESLAHNVNRKLGDVMMYEFGNVYSFNPAAESTAERPLTPYHEESRLGIWLTGAINPGNWAIAKRESSFYDLKAIVANIFARLGISEREIKLTTGDSELFSASLNIATRSGKPLGIMGIVSPTQSAKTGLKQPAVFAELMWSALVSLAAKRSPLFSALPRTMPVRRDLALLVDTTVTMAQIDATVRESERKLLRNIELFDVYEGKNLPSGKKSYAIAITLQDDEKTLTDAQIDAAMAKITANLTKKTGATLR